MYNADAAVGDGGDAGAPTQARKRRTGESAKRRLVSISLVSEVMTS